MNRSVVAISCVVSSTLLLAACTGKGGNATPTPGPSFIPPSTTAAVVATRTPQVASGMGENHAPVISPPQITVVNEKPGDAHPNRGDTLKAVFTVTDPDGDLVTTDIKWVVNGTEVGQGDTLAPGKTSHGAPVVVDVTATDGRGLSTKVSATITIRNSAPVFSTVPSSLNGYHPAATDPDGDPVTLELSGALPPGFKFEGGTLTFDPAAGKAAEGQTVTFVAKDNAGGVTTQGVLIHF